MTPARGSPATSAESDQALRASVRAMVAAPGCARLPPPTCAGTLSGHPRRSTLARRHTSIAVLPRLSDPACPRRAPQGRPHPSPETGSRKRGSPGPVARVCAAEPALAPPPRVACCCVARAHRPACNARAHPAPLPRPSQDRGTPALVIKDLWPAKNHRGAIQGTGACPGVVRRAPRCIQSISQRHATSPAGCPIGIPSPGCSTWNTRRSPVRCIQAASGPVRLHHICPASTVATTGRMRCSTWNTASRHAWCAPEPPARPRSPHHTTPAAPGRASVATTAAVHPPGGFCAPSLIGTPPSTCPLTRRRSGISGEGHRPRQEIQSSLVGQRDQDRAFAGPPSFASSARLGTRSTARGCPAPRSAAPSCGWGR